MPYPRAPFSPQTKPWKKAGLGNRDGVNDKQMKISATQARESASPAASAAGPWSAAACCWEAAQPGLFAWSQSAKSRVQSATTCRLASK